jgi:hypothetical protein
MLRSLEEHLWKESESSNATCDGTSHYAQLIKSEGWPCVAELDRGRTDETS